MYSKQEVKQLKKDFWVAFAKAYPRKWILFKTDIKDFAFKFYIDKRKAEVALEISSKDEEKKKVYFEKIESLQTILKNDFLPDVNLKKDYISQGNLVHRVWVEKHEISLYNKDSWTTIFSFFAEQMNQFELFFEEYQDYIKAMDLNR